MIWYLTKGNHKLAIQPWVRWWLRTGIFGRLVVVIVIFLAFLGLSIVAAAMTLYSQYTAAAVNPYAPYSQSGGSPFLQFIATLIGLGCKLVMILLWVGWIIDSIMERKITRDDIKTLMSSRKIVLATRGEYIGGHPQLPHGRFVYLTLGGALENPQLNIVLPQAEGKPEDIFTMPILDLQKTTQQVEKTGDETTANVTLASVTFRAKFLGEQATLNTEYIGQAGRKQVVEITRFLFGNSEIQTWCNYIVCIQAEADTGKPPYGPWKSLPAGQPTP